MRDLILWVQPNSCVCGNRWTHSYVTYDTGGTASPQDLHQGKVTRLNECHTRHHDHCFRCITLAMGIGWSKPPSVAQPEPRTAPSLAELEATIFGKGTEQC